MADVEDARALEAEEALSILSAAWDKLHRVRAAMLGELFDSFDRDDDGRLSVAEFWGGLQQVLRGMKAAGGEHEALAEPWMERGEAELLYQQVLIESEFLGVAGSALELVVAREPFVQVMMRRRLYALDYDEFMEEHAEERFFP